MEKMNALTLIITLVVGIILAGSLLAPVITSTQENNHDTLSNPVVYAPGYDDAATFTLDGLDDYKLESNPIYTEFKINGQKVDINRWQYVPQKIVTDKCRVEMTGHYAQLFDATGTRIGNVSTSSKNVVFEYDADTKVFTATTYTDLTSTTVEAVYTYNVNQILYADPNGEYGAINTNGDPSVTYYVNDLSQLVAGGAYLTGELDTGYFAEGSTVYTSNTDYSGTATATTEKYQNYTDVVTGSSYTVSITNGTDTETFTPFVVYVPMNISAHTQEQNGQNVLYGAIPIIVIVALLMAAVGAIAYRRAD